MEGDDKAPCPFEQGEYNDLYSASSEATTTHQTDTSEARDSHTRGRSIDEKTMKLLPFAKEHGTLPTLYTIITQVMRAFYSLLAQILRGTTCKHHYDRRKSRWKDLRDYVNQHKAQLLPYFNKRNSPKSEVRRKHKGKCPFKSFNKWYFQHLFSNVEITTAFHYYLDLLFDGDTKTLQRLFRMKVMCGDEWDAWMGLKDVLREMTAGKAGKLL